MPDALTALNQSVAQSGRGSTELAALGHVYAVAGRLGEARQVLRELVQTAGEKYISPYDIAVVHAGLGDRDQVFVWLEKAYAQRDGWLAGHVNVDPRFDPLRKDPQFQDLLRRIGLR